MFSSLKSLFAKFWGRQFCSEVFCGLGNNSGWMRIVLRVKRENNNKEFFLPTSYYCTHHLNMLRPNHLYSSNLLALVRDYTFPLLQKENHFSPSLFISDLPGFVSHSNGRSSLQTLNQSLTWAWTSEKISRLWICFVLLRKEAQHMTP